MSDKCFICSRELRPDQRRLMFHICMPCEGKAAALRASHERVVELETELKDKDRQFVLGLANWEMRCKELEEKLYVASLDYQRLEQKEAKLRKLAQAVMDQKGLVFHLTKEWLELEEGLKEGRVGDSTEDQKT